MTNEQFKHAIDKLGLTQLAAARLLGVDGRTVRRWAIGERQIHFAAAILLRLLLSGDVTIEAVERVVKREAVLRSLGPERAKKK